MTDHAMLFSGPMVRALPEGRKTQTRRTLKRLRRFGPITEFGPSDTPGFDWHFRDKEMRWHDLRHTELLEYLPVKVGDRAWVREAHAVVGSVDPGWVLYRADGYENECMRHGFDRPYPPEPKWKPSIFMPRWASRLTLHVEDVRVQRLQEISEEDAIGEGVGLCPHARPNYRVELKMPNSLGANAVDADTARSCFRRLWESINGAGSWDANPWICAISFRTERANIEEARE